jgi:hypothetical protein
MVSQDAFHQPSSIKPMPYSSFDSPLPSGVESDSGYGSTPSSVQQMANENDHFAWSSSGKRPLPFPAAPRNATKRIRPATDRLEFSLLGNPKQAHEGKCIEVSIAKLSNPSQILEVKYYSPLKYPEGLYLPKGSMPSWRKPKL